jgi:protein arginine kinase activator
MMGCPHDYAHFEARILPLVKRAQEGAVQHAGKVPSKIEHTEVTREVTTSRLRRELQRAVDAERYEEAARLRDELRRLEAN